MSGARTLWFIAASLLISVIFGLGGGTARASDPLRLDSDFGLLQLSPYMSPVNDGAKGGQVFAIQNSGSQRLDLILQRAPLSDLAVALRLQSGSRPVLRLFTSDDTEFAAGPSRVEGLSFFVPAGQVQSFYLPNIKDGEVLYLWSPEQQATHLASRQTYHSAMLLLLAILFVLAILVAILRRSRRAVYGVTMGGGLMVLLGSLWLNDVFSLTSQWASVVRYRLEIIQIALGLGAFMSVLGHLNLVFRLAVNRNYWTRVIIFADFSLLATGGLWAAEIFMPGFAGIISSELGDIALAVTCSIVLLGAFFVPDRR